VLVERSSKVAVHGGAGSNLEPAPTGHRSAASLATEQVRQEGGSPMPGPSAAPAQLRLLNGKAPGKDVAGRTVPIPPPFRRRTPAPPTWLSREAKAEWRRVVPELTRLDLLKDGDRAALAAYCETWATFVDATRAVRKGGLTVRNESTRKDGTTSTWWTTNPAVGIAAKAGQELRALAREFGLTPSSETALSREEGGRVPGGNAPPPAADSVFA